MSLRTVWLSAVAGALALWTLFAVVILLLA